MAEGLAAQRAGLKGGGRVGGQQRQRRGAAQKDQTEFAYKMGRGVRGGRFKRPA